MADESNREPKPFQGELPTFSVSALQIATSAWMVHLIMGEATPWVSPGPPGSHSNETMRMVASLPWPLAKLLHRVLGAAIAEFEKREGTVPIPQTVDAAMTATIAKLGNRS